jgi:ABC-2 type transport system permease protein
MRQIAAIFKKELSITFTSPIFYAAAFIFLVVSGYLFYSNTAHFSILSFQATSSPYMSERLNVSDMVIIPLFGDLSTILLLMLPLITMRLYAEEKRTGTIELLFTYPVSDMAALIGKFCATVLVLLTLLLGTIPYLIILEFFGSLEWGVVISGYMGMILLGGSFIALGIFTSSLTENQIVAAVLSFGALLLFWMIGWTTSISGPFLSAILGHISIVSHFDSFTVGLVDSRDIVFYLSFILFWLFLTLRFLNSRYWRG